MGVEKSWHRPWVCNEGHCRRDPVGTNVFVCQCDHCGKTTSVTIRGAGDPLMELGWEGDFNECYCKECR